MESNNGTMTRTQRGIMTFFSKLTILALLATMMSSVLVGTPVALAATITVDTTDGGATDDGECSLSEAIESANAGGDTNDDCVDGADGGQDTIQFEDGLGTIVLSADLPAIEAGEDLTIDGNGPDNTIIDGDDIYTVFHATDANLTIQDVTIQNASGATHGPAVYVENTTGTDKALIVTNAVFTNNHPDTVTGNPTTTIYHGGAISINNSGSSNVASTITNAAFMNNYANYSQTADLCAPNGCYDTAGGSGGAIYAENNSSGDINLTIGVEDGTTSVMFVGNSTSADGQGGALYVANNGSGSPADPSDVNVNIWHTTFNGNVAGSNGGAIGTYDDGQNDANTTLTVEDDTFNCATGRAGDYNSWGNGGAIYNETSGNDDESNTQDVAIHTSIFDQCLAYDSGGAIYNEFDDTFNTTSVVSSTFTMNSADNGDGGAIYQYGDKITIGQSSFTENTADNGGGIYADGWLNVAQSDISNNTAGYQGGGVYHDDGGWEDDASTITESAITGNRTEEYYSGGDYYGGAGLYNTGWLTITDSTVSENYANGYANVGGGIYNSDLLGLVNNDITDNQSNGHGAAIYNQWGLLYSEGNTINHNMTDYGSGGAIFNDYGSVESLDDDISYNQARGVQGDDRNGGAIASVGTPGVVLAAVVDIPTESLVIFNGTITNNTASGTGGGIYMWAGTAVISETLIQDNSAADDGGGIYAEDEYNNTNSIEIYNTSIERNDATGNSNVGAGGGIYAWNETMLISNTLITGNQADYGAGMMAENLSDVTIQNSQIVKNTAYSGEGGASFYESTFTIDSSTVAMNKSEDYAGGIFVKKGNGTVVDSTIAQNTAKGDGGGILRTGVGTLAIESSTIYGNLAGGMGAGIYNETLNGSMTINNSTISSNQIGSTWNYAPPSMMMFELPYLLPYAGDLYELLDERRVAEGDDFDPALAALLPEMLKLDMAYEQGLDSSVLTTLTQNAGAAATALKDLQDTYNGNLDIAFLDTVIPLFEYVASAQTPTTGMGGGIYNVDSDMSLTNATVAGNSAATGGGIYNETTDGSVTVEQTLLALNDAAASPDCGGSGLVSEDYNLVGNTNGCTISGTTTNDISNKVAFLGMAFANGGPTWTHAIWSNSPALNAVPADACANDVDQRGVARPQNDMCDIGAYEKYAGPRLDAQFYKVDESVGELTIGVSMDMVPSEDLTVNYTTTDGTAIAGKDYTPVSGTLTFAAGTPVTATQTITVAITDDLSNEGNEAFELDLVETTSWARRGNPSFATIVISDNDGLDVAFEQNQYYINEDDGRVTLTVTTDLTSEQDIEIGYKTVADTATSDSDYDAVEGTVTIPAGEQTAEIEVLILNDDIGEGVEDFVVELVRREDGLAGLGNPWKATVTIYDDDPVPTAAFGEPGDPMAGDTVSETVGTALIPVTLDYAMPTTVTIGFETSNGSAVAGEDYMTTTGELSFPPADDTTQVSLAQVGGTPVTQYISVTILNDWTTEDDETFNITLSSDPSQPVELGDVYTTTVTIQNEPGRLYIPLISSTQVPTTTLAAR